MQATTILAAAEMEMQARAGQPRRHSVLEAILNVVVGYVVAIAAQCAIFPWFGIHIAFRSDLAIGAAFTVVSLVRSYTLRRLFNIWQTRSAA